MPVAREKALRARHWSSQVWNQAYEGELAIPMLGSNVQHHFVPGTDDVEVCSETLQVPDALLVLVVEVITLHLVVHGTKGGLGNGIQAPPFC